MSSKYSFARAPGREHIPLHPRGFIALRIVQLVMAVLVLALSAFVVYYAAFDGDVFILAVAVMTVIACIYQIVAWFLAPSIYNYWAILSLDVTLVILWLCSFALLAAEVANVMSLVDEDDETCDVSGCVDTAAASAVAAVLAATSAVGAVEFVLHIVSLSIHGVILHRHRAAGLHCNALRDDGHAHKVGNPAMTGPNPVRDDEAQRQQQQVRGHHFPSSGSFSPDKIPVGAVAYPVPPSTAHSHDWQTQAQPAQHTPVSTEPLPPAAAEGASPSWPYPAPPPVLQQQHPA